MPGGGTPTCSTLLYLNDLHRGAPRLQYFPVLINHVALLGIPLHLSKHSWRIGCRVAAAAVEAATAANPAAEAAAVAAAAAEAQNGMVGGQVKRQAVGEVSWHTM